MKLIEVGKRAEITCDIDVDGMSVTFLNMSIEFRGSIRDVPDTSFLICYTDQRGCQPRYDNPRSFQNTTTGNTVTISWTDGVQFTKLGGIKCGSEKIWMFEYFGKYIVAHFSI